MAKNISKPKEVFVKEQSDFAKYTCNEERLAAKNAKESPKEEEVKKKLE